jgi:hypothetical protein
MSLILNAIGLALVAASMMSASIVPAVAQKKVYEIPQPYVSPFRGSRADTSAPGRVPNIVETPADRSANTPYPSVRIPDLSGYADQPRGRIGSPMPVR